MMMVYNDALVMESQLLYQFVTSNVVQWKATESRVRTFERCIADLFWLVSSTPFINSCILY